MITPSVIGNEGEKKKKEYGENDVVRQCKDFLKLAKDATEPGYRLMLEDLRFLDGDQWDMALKADRNNDGRPCLTINKLPTFLDQIIGDQRLNRPSIKILPVDDQADKDTADILSGLIKNIEVQSNASVAYDTGFDAAASCGFGAWRIITDYVDEGSFDQEIKIIPIDNQFSVYLDPDAKLWDGSDGKAQVITEMLERSEFKEKWPDSAMVEFESDRDTQLEGWTSGDKIRVAEFFVKEFEKKTIYLVQNQDGSQEVIDKKDFNAGIHKKLKERDTEIPKIMWYRVTGREILEGPTEWPGRYFPVIPIWGKKLNIENKKVFRGIVRHAKDPQRLYNYNRSMSAEAISLAPRAPYLLTPKQIDGFEGIWKLANKKNYPYIPYNPDPQSPPPQRQPANPVSAGIQNEIIVSDQELHDTTGLQRSSLGKQSNEKSGKAIIARQKEGDVGSFDFTNSQRNALIHTGKVLIDLIPRIYDTARVIRIIGEDGKDSMVPINQEVQITEKIRRAFDFSVGKYDVAISTGPSFTTQREEMRTSMMEFVQYVPNAGPLVMDLVAGAMDWPNADEFAERLKPPGTEEDMTPEMKAKQEILLEAEMRTLQAQTEQEELKAEQIELENQKIAQEVKKLQAETREILAGDEDESE